MPAESVEPLVFEPGASYVEPEPQEETTSEEERVAAAAALVERENAVAPAEVELGLVRLSS